MYTCTVYIYIYIGPKIQSKSDLHHFPQQGNDDGHLHEDVSLVVLALWQNVLQTARAFFNHSLFTRKEGPVIAGQPVQSLSDVFCVN